MVIEKVYVNNHGKGRETALSEIDRFSVYLGLSQKNKLHLRLLTEEMLGMVAGISGDFSADFWAEHEGSVCRLCMEASVHKMDEQKRESLINISTSGRNAAETGLMWKIKNVFEAILFGGYDVGGAYDGYANTYLPSGIASLSDSTIDLRFGGTGDDRDKSGAEGKKWDELEKSIVANIADHISVGVKGDTVTLIISKKL